MEFRIVDPASKLTSLRGLRGVVYCLVNKANNKRYVGRTTKTMLCRLSDHKCSKQLIGKAIGKHGEQNFYLEILEVVTDWSKLPEREAHWIVVMDCICPKGYNLTAGGDGILFATEEVRRKISLSHLGKPRPDVVPENLTGIRFGRLVPVSVASRKPPKWLCRCDCGREHVTSAAQLKSGNCRSCGCLRRENTKSMKTTHGRSKTSTYSTWLTITKHKAGVCAQWENSYESFLEDMGERPPGGIICRRSRSAGFSPSNCFWGSWRDHLLNHSATMLLFADGKTLTKTGWMKELRVHQRRIDKGLKMFPVFQDCVEALRAHQI